MAARDLRAWVFPYRRPEVDGYPEMPRSLLWGSLLSFGINSPKLAAALMAARDLRAWVFPYRRPEVDGYPGNTPLLATGFFAWSF